MAHSTVQAETQTANDTVTTVTVPKPPSTLFYFAYGSNLSSTQMHARCPTSQSVALGRLRGWEFLINERGYANVVQPSTATTSTVSPDVYGVLYQLGSADEKAELDAYEGVPTAYEDVILPVEIVQDGGDGGEQVVVGFVWALVYVDRWRTAVGRPKGEYVGRMNRGLEEADREWGLPSSYVRTVVRKFIPEEE